MTRLSRSVLIATALLIPAVGNAQDVAPLFEGAPAVLYETYRAVDAPVFNEYFEMLTERYAGSDGFGWGVYTQNATVAHRITALPNGLESMVEVQRARGVSFQDFTEEQRVSRS